MAQIVTVGEILVEFVATRVGQDLASAGEFAGPYPSGAPAIFVDQAARMGCPAAIVGCVGTDLFGDCVLSRLRADGVDVGGVRRVSDVATGVAFVAYRADGGRGFIFHMSNSAAGRVTAENLDPAIFAGCRFLHVMGSSLFSPLMGELIRRAAEQATAAGARLSFDPNVRKELLGLSGTAELIQELAHRADLLLPSEVDLEYLCPGLAPDEAARCLLDGPAQCVLIKRGAAGTVYYDRQGRIETPAFAVKEVDPTGAGDATGATFLACLLQGAPMAQALLRANAAGALAVGRRGPMEGNSTPAQIDALIAGAA